MLTHEARALPGSTSRERQIRSPALTLALGLFAAAALQLAAAGPGDASTPRAASLVTLILIGGVGAYAIQLAESFQMRRAARGRAGLGGTIIVTSELRLGSTLVVEWPRIAA